MKQKLGRMVLVGSLVCMMAMPTGLTVQAAETETQSVAATQTKKTKLSDTIDAWKIKIAGLLGIDIGEVGDVTVDTNDDIDVTVDGNNINIDIDLNLINININK